MQKNANLLEIINLHKNFTGWQFLPHPDHPNALFVQGQMNP